MVLPFDRQPLLHKRYAYLALPAGLDAPKESKEPSPGGEEYANFLRWVICLLSIRDPVAIDSYCCLRVALHVLSA